MTTTSRILPALEELKQLPQWVCYGKDKKPLIPATGLGADCGDPATWDTWKNAQRACSDNGYAGIGFEFVKEQGRTGVDFDHCIRDGQISDYAQYWIKRLNSYTEISPSGDGLHVIGLGTIPKCVPADVKHDGDKRTEMYDCERYFTVTGNHVEGTPDTINDFQDALNALYLEVTTRRNTAKQQEREQKARAKAGKKTSSPLTSSDTTYGLQALREECDDMRETPEGGRWEQLRRSAFRLGQLIGGGELTRATVEKELYAAADHTGLPDSQIERTLKDCIDAGQLSPRSRPAPADPAQPSAPGAGPLVKKFNCTDLGNAERFAARYRDKVRWCETWNTWLVYNGKCWERDRTGRVDQLGKATVRAIYKEAAEEEDENLRAKIAKHAAASESNRAIRAMLDRAKSELPATTDQFNKHLHLLNCNNCTINLMTGKKQEHNPEDMLTYCLRVNYNPEAKCPLWIKFVNTIFSEDEALIDFVQTALGMSISGDIREQCWFLCYGDGNNGKTTLLETPRTILDEYGLSANIESFLVRKDERNYDKAEFYGKRMITASEIPPKSRLNESFIKKVTGGEPLRAARKFENEFPFQPECTIWLSVNHKPVVKDTSKGMWRRVRYIPFNVTIPDEQVDTDLPKKLLGEAEGILAWLVAGCVTWYKNGRLIVPEIVKEATKKYQEEQDTIARFFAEECDFRKDAYTFTRDLNARYELWCDQKQEKPDTTALKEALNGLKLHSKRSTGGKWRYEGIALKPIDSSSDESNGPCEESDGTHEEITLKSDGSDGSDMKVSKAPRNELHRETLPLSMSLPSLPSLSELEQQEKSDGTITLQAKKEEKFSSREENSEKKLSPAAREALDQRYQQMQRESAENLLKRLDTVLAGHQAVTWQGERIPSSKFRGMIRGYIDQALYDQAIEPMRDVLRYLEVGA